MAQQINVKGRGGEVGVLYLVRGGDYRK